MGATSCTYVVLNKGTVILICTVILHSQIGVFAYRTDKKLDLQQSEL